MRAKMTRPFFPFSPKLVCYTIEVEKKYWKIEFTMHTWILEVLPIVVSCKIFFSSAIKSWKLDLSSFCCHCMFKYRHVNSRHWYFFNSEVMKRKTIITSFMRAIRIVGLKENHLEAHFWTLLCDVYNFRPLLPYQHFQSPFPPTVNSALTYTLLAFN